jgi:hypothetical protein
MLDVDSNYSDRNCRTTNKVVRFLFDIGVSGK